MEAREPAPGGMHPSFARVIRQREELKIKLSKIRHKIGVYSAKGGVGKTTIAVNLAYTLARMGKSVGLLDADIDCPNLPMFLGLDKEKIDTSNFPLKPILKQGVKVASTAMVLDEIGKPIIWRGPMITKMLTELFDNVEWGELDYLIIDLPPGTSDSPLTIMQLLTLDGFVIVTNPQRIAGINSMRSGLMARRLNVSLIGVIENMSTGHPSASTTELLQALQTDLLGVVERSDIFDRLSDSGKVPVLEDQDLFEAFRAIAGKFG